jgi:hypothetical protein
MAPKSSDAARSPSSSLAVARVALRDRGITGPRVVLVVSLLAGVGHLAYAGAVAPGRFGLNYAVYRGVGEWVLAGHPLYAGSPVGDPAYTYLYPPVVAPLFVPLALVGPTVGYAAFTASSLFAGAALGAGLVRLAAPAGRRPARVDRWLIGAVGVASVYPMPSHVFGNVNVAMAAALCAATVATVRAGSDGESRSTPEGVPVDAPADGGHAEHRSGETAAVDTGAGAGAGRPLAAGGWLAVAAAAKLFPSVLGVWLLARRAWRAAGAACLTGLGLAAAGVVLFGVDAHVAYVTRALLPRRDGAAFAGGLPPAAEYVTLQRPLSRLAPDLDPSLFPLLAAGLVAPVVGLTFLRASRRGRETDWLVALHALTAGLLLVLPSYPTYYVLLVVTLVPLCYRLPAGRARRLFLAGALLAPVTLRPAQAATLLEAAPVPPTTARAILAAVEPVLTFGSGRLYGVAATLIACGLDAFDRR